MRRKINNNLSLCQTSSDHFGNGLFEIAIEGAFNEM